MIQVTDNNTEEHQLHYQPWNTLLVTDHHLNTAISTHPSSLSFLGFQMRGLGSETLLNAHPPLSSHSHNQSFHYRRQSECLFLITSLSCLSLEMDSKRRSCTAIFAGTEVSQQLTAFQTLFFAILEYDCIVCFFNSSCFFTDNTQQPWNASSQEGNYSSQHFQYL